MHKAEVTNSITDLLAEIEALHQKATPGELRVVRVDAHFPEGAIEYELSIGNTMVAVVKDTGYTDGGEPNEGGTRKHLADLIVALRNAWPRLREELAQAVEDYGSR